jgi:hypothetical protein
MAASVVPNALVQDFASISRPPSNDHERCPEPWGHTSSRPAVKKPLLVD